MLDVLFLPPAARFIKKIKDKKLKELYQQAVDEIRNNPNAGTVKTGDLAGIYGYDIFYNRTNYELAYTILYQDEQIIVVIMAGMRENFYDELKWYLNK